MNRVFIAIIIIGFTITSCAQGKYGVVKSQAFYREAAPGAMSSDNSSNPQSRTDTMYSVFLETKPAMPTVWKKAWVGDKTYNVLSTIMATPHIAGMKKEVEEEIVISTDEKNQLVQLNLEKSTAEPIPAKYKTAVSPKAILLQGVQNDKVVYMVIDAMEQVRGKEHQ